MFAFTVCYSGKPCLIPGRSPEGFPAAGPEHGRNRAKPRPPHPPTRCPWAPLQPTGPLESRATRPTAERRPPPRAAGARGLG